MEAGKHVGQSGAGSEPQADWIIIVAITVFPIGYCIAIECMHMTCRDCDM